MPFKSIIGLIIAFGFLFVVYMIVKNYVFGDLGKLGSLDKLSDFMNVD